MASKRHFDEKNQNIAWGSFIKCIKDLDDNTKDILHTHIICGLYELIFNYHMYNKSIPNEWSDIISIHKTQLLEYAQKSYIKKRVEFNNKYKNYIGESAQYMYDYRLIQLMQKIIHYIKNL